MRDETMKTEYYLIKSDILPEVFTKVMEVKRLLGLGKATSVNQAVKMVDLSRSAYYKYKDSILPFYETSRGKLVTVIFMVEDFPGILSGIVNALADANANILTINQNIPINGLADVSIVIETDKLNTELEYLLTDIERIPGVRSYKILARE
ncbi:MAG: ACT domain-containing protein [Eubacteriales bacterium]|nr:ACT domain-containing protein [Eubacteriales bacterium]